MSAVEKAKTEIFGNEPSCGLAQIGRNIAINYFDRIIDHAEPILMGQAANDTIISQSISKGFEFAVSPSLDNFPIETKEEISIITERFKQRYADIAPAL